MKRITFGLVLGLLVLAGLVLGSAAQAATPCADLVVDSVTSVPGQPVMGQPSTIAVSVRNAGTCASGGFGVQWRPDLLAAALPTAPVADLGAGATTVVNFPYSFPRTGIFLSFATVDVTNAVAETNESNNLVSKVFTPSPGVDLVVSSVSVDPAAPVAGQPASVSIKVSNQGVNPAGAFRVDWSPSFGAPAIPQQVTGLGAGASTTLTFPYTYASAGTFGSLATVDAGSTVAETNEFNNVTTQSVTVIPLLPELVITSATTDPEPAFASSLVTVTVTVRNVGLLPAGSFTVRWQPWLLGTPATTQVSGLNPGASATVTLGSLFTATGSFDGTVTADSTSAVAEINEFNNTASTHVTVVAPTLNAQKVATGGFGDYQNSYSWSMAWFKGKLYVGTARHFHCVEAATLDFYYPGQGYYNGPLDGLPPEQGQCPTSYYDLDLRAEIWQYTPETGVWKRVYQSPTIPNPRAPGKDVARDIGYRGMVVYTDPATGEQALYVGGVTADEYIPELAAQYPPRILRSVDGETFTPLPTGPGVIHNTSGTQYPIGFRAMTVFDNRLFVTASGGLGGDGVALEVKDPFGPSPQYVQVSPNTMQVYEMEPFNGTLYLGFGAPSGGYSVYKVTDWTAIPFGLTPVVTGGAGRGDAITSVVSMRVFKGRLYVGSNGWGQGQNSELAAEEIRINPDDTWDVVAGKPRLVDGVMKAPISGLGDGFGNFFTAHMWRAETHNGAMYIGTNDASGAWQDPRLGRISELLAPEFGFDVWGTCDGQYWWQVTRNAFGDGKWNFGARTIQSTPFGVFIGSTNHVEGTSIWKGDASPCGSGGGGGPEFSPMKRAQSETAGGTTHETVSLARPARLVADQQVCGSGLSWDRVDGAARYRILRSRYRSFDVAMKLPPKLPGGGYLPDQLPMPASGTGPATTHRVWIAGPYTAIGVTTKTTFVDRSAAQGARYNYEVVTVGSSGATSQPSNVAAVPSQASTATFDELGSALAHASDAARPKDGAAMRKLTRLADDARTSWRKGGPSAARPILTRLHNELVADKARGVGTNRTALDDMENVVFRLERLASMNVACSHG